MLVIIYEYVDIFHRYMERVSLYRMKDAYVPKIDTMFTENRAEFYC